ncbi:MAG: VRR-NUC domain-containing protein [Muribaculaceae bacterium]|nr:VRR-NUC domain-containing protein [Muribaculaceae bacterium]
MNTEERIYRNSEISEKVLEKTFVEKVREMGLIVIKNQDPMQSGMPDRLVVMPRGKVAWVEFKSRGKHMTALQSNRAKKLSEMKHLVILIDSRKDLDIALAFIKGCID